MTVVNVSALALVMLLFLWRPARESLWRLVGIESSSAIDRKVILKALNLLLLIALVCVINPELRLALLSIDSIGIDIFLLFLAFQGHEYLLLITRAAILPLGRGLLALAPYPMTWPSRRVFRDYPLWGTFATVQFLVMVGAITLVAWAYISPLREAIHVLL